uniref:Uncharacterized protein n=1 Tax=Schistosoma haematobium TaxID=6185 RepID=A0A095C1D1_SCHHA
MRNTEKSENLWCFSFIHYLMDKYFNYKTMQSHEQYITLKHNNGNSNSTNLQYRRQSFNENVEKSKNVLKKSTTMLLTNNTTTNNNQMNINTIFHCNALATNNSSQTYKSIKNQLNSTPIWKCPHCFTEIQLINIQTTPDIIIQSNRLYHKKIRTNPWINNSKYNIPITSYSYSSSLTDSGIYLCTDNNKNNNNNSHYDYITRSTTETDINKNNYFNVKKNDIPIIPISPDPPPSPAPKCTQCIINPECLKHTNENQDLFMNSNKSYKGFCKSATLDLSNLINDTNKSINKPKRKLLTKRIDLTINEEQKTFVYTM